MADAALDILKEALLLEWRGRAFYQKVAEQAQNEAVREFFETMVAEEQQHMDILGEHSLDDASVLARAMRDGRIMTIFAGTNEIMKEICSKFMGI